MLQRIQTVFLFIAMLAALAHHFVSKDVDLFESKSLPIAVLSFVSFLLALGSIISFKNRRRQILLNNINMFINALLIGLLMFWLLNLSGGIVFPEKGIEPVFPIVAMFCLFMANLYIRRDERLVKSVDRLR